ncbi:MAG: hypothetical protein VB858_16970 [Planctomycetaceae bacterium]
MIPDGGVWQRLGGCLRFDRSRTDGRERASHRQATGHKVRSPAEEAQPTKAGQEPAQQEEAGRNAVMLTRSQSVRND